MPISDRLWTPQAKMTPQANILARKNNGTALTLPEWWVPPEVQIAHIRHWNKTRKWGFDESAIAQNLPDFTAKATQEVPVLAIYLPDQASEPGYIRTIKELWLIARLHQLSSWQWDELYLDQKHLRLLPDKQMIYRPGVRWVSLNLTAHWSDKGDVYPRHCRNIDSADVEILAAAAHSPAWIQAMDGKTTPFVSLAGCQVTIAGHDAWRHLPTIEYNWRSGIIELSADWDDVCDHSRALVECHEM